MLHQPKTDGVIQKHISQSAKDPEMSQSIRKIGVPEPSSQPLTKPKIKITFETSSPTLSLTNTTDPFTITLTATLQYHTVITVHVFSNVFSTCASGGKGIESCLVFVAHTPLHDDVLAEDPLAKKTNVQESSDGRARDANGEEKMAKNYWAYYQDFISLSPIHPFTTKLKFLPRPLPRPESPPRQKDKDWKWIWGTTPPPPQPFDWGFTADLEEGVEYQIRLKEGTYVKWWRPGQMDDFMEIYESYGAWWADLLTGKMWQPKNVEGVLEREQWIELIGTGEGRGLKW
jgi:hypothetical protein